jgi:hypothetical protein
MNTWTAHLKRDAEPVLIKEGFSWGAFFLGPIWLAVHRAWVPAAICLAAYLLVLFLIPIAALPIVALAISWLVGLSGHDLRRWSFSHRGFLETYVLIARSESDALGRLLADRQDLVGRFSLPGPVK